MAIGLLTLAGFSARANALGDKDLRGDEGFAAVFAAQPPAAIWQALGQSEPHPPLYYLLLHAQIALAGTSSYALRYLSVLFGALVIPALAAAGWHLLGRRAALAAGFLAAVNPLLIWQAQDARMYAQLAGCVALALAGAAAVLRAGRIEAAARLVTLAGVAGAVLTHFYALLAVAGLAGGLLVAGRAGAVRKPAAGRLAAETLLLATALALPLLLHGRPALLGHGAFAALTPAGLLRDLGLTLAGGLTTPVPLRPAVGLLGLPLAALALAATGRRHGRAAVLLAGTLLAPLLGLLALDLTHPAYQPPYAAVLAPAWLLAVAALAAPRRLLPLAVPATLALTVVAAFSLRAYANLDKAPTWQLAAALLRRQGRPGDAVVTNFPDPTLGWVYGRQQGGDLPVRLEPPAMPVDRPALDAAMTALGERYGRVWFWTERTAAWDPQHDAELWLDHHDLPLRTVRAGDVEFRLFETPRGFLAGTQPLPDVSFGGQLRLRGASAPPATVAPGTSFDLELCWQAVAAPRQDYTAFVHLERGSLLAGQDDHPPAGGLAPASTWRPGESFLDHYRLTVPPDATPGTYALRVGLYAPATLRRLSVQDAGGNVLGDAMAVGQVTVR